MVRSKNKFQTVQLIAGILLAVYLLFNINSLTAMQDANDRVPDATIEVSSTLADLSNRVQNVTEDGFLQSIVSSVFGEGVSLSLNDTPQADVAIEPPVNTTAGNMGDWIEDAGYWLAGLWESGEEPIEAVKSAETTDFVAVENPIADEMVLAVEPFSHLSRPYVSHVPMTEEQYEALDHVEDNIMI